MGPNVRRASLALLGPFDLRVDGAEVPIGSARQRQLLVRLAVGAALDVPVSSDELVVGLYGDPDPAAAKKARRALSTEVWRGRQLLGADAIVADADGYRLDTDVVAVDVVEFLDLVQAGRAALEDDDPAAGEPSLTAALALWRAAPHPDLAAGPDGAALLAQLEEMHDGATDDRAAALAALGRHREVIDALKPVVRERPHREHACALLVRSYLAVGEVRRAQVVLDAATAALASYDLAPGPDLQAALDLVAGPTERVEAVRPTLELVGRDDQLGRCVAVGSAALHQFVPAAVVVTGEPGIGKTALVDRAASELARASGAHNTVERIACDLRLALPFAAMAPLLRRLRDVVGGGGEALAAILDGGPPDASLPAPTTDAVTTAVVELVEAAADTLGGLVLVVEDVHWASVELIDTLQLLLARRTPTPVCLLVTQRDPAVVAEPLRAALVELRRRAEAVIRLEGLDAEHTAMLLGPAADPAEVARIHRLTGGNPLYLRNLAHPASYRGAGTAREPASLGEALDEHLDSLGDDVVRVLEVAAVIGSEFDRWVLTGALAPAPYGVGPSQVADALARARDAGVVRAEADNLIRFSHALVRDRLADRTSSDARVAAHAAVAAALARAVEAGTGSLDALAFHSLHGWPTCPTTVVVDRLRAAGDEATRQLAFAAAQRLYRQALDLVAADPGYDTADAGGLLLACGQAAVAAADLEGARSSYRALLAHGVRSGRLRLRVEATLGLLQTYTDERVSTGVLDDLEEALARAVDAPGELSSELLTEAVGALHTYRPSAARSLRSRAVSRDPAVESRLLARVWEQETVGAQREIAGRLAELTDADPLSVQTREHVAAVADGVRSLADAPRGWSAADGSEAARWEALLWQTTVAVASGGFARAERLLQLSGEQAGRAATAVDLAGRTGSVLGQRAWLAHYRGDIETLLASLTAAQPTWNLKRPIQRMISIYTSTVLDDPVKARSTCEALVDELLDGIAPGGEQLAPLVALGGGCINAAEWRGLALCEELLRPHAGRHVVHWVTQYWGSVEYNLARFAAASGELDAAIDWYDAALAAHRKVDARVFEALTLRGAAATRWVRDGRGDRDVAVRLDREAAALGAELGMPQLTRGAWPPSGPLDLGGAFTPVWKGAPADS